MTAVPRPVDVKTCGTCGQQTLLLFLASLPPADVAIVGHCPECDAGHCSQCGRHVPTRGAGWSDKFCTECGASLKLD